ncbi:acyl-CoA dehydrogenase family protein [Actinokineospora sp. NBRC 105648]|uniref:acyl-CoA dehydrogenase family protein n=1 Tax=Actinokineospora sp. NBRC 105648 TaxID=3032206 RepID=UPI00255507E7|nr:acyl-CoA dehydrogenase family protein [Actinokineospora sp. NBRC 105648]
MAGLVTELIGDQAGAWDLDGHIPREIVRELGRAGVLCAQAPAAHGGLGLSNVDAGELTAHVGALCSSTRSLMTSQGMAAWTVERFGDDAQRAEYLGRLTAGETAGVAFSEPGAGSDLSGMATRIETEGDSVVVTGQKVWVTGAAYADLLVVFGRVGEGAGAVLVPTDAPGVTVTRVPDPLGCRAAGHADVLLDGVRLPADHVLAGAGLPLEWLVTSALTYGRLSVAWGCVGILRGCLAETTRHARTRQQFGRPLADHQLVARHLAELHVAERAATALCAEAARGRDAGGPEHVSAAVTAKHFAAGAAVRGAASAVQVLASAGARDGHPVARAHRDAKLMEIIEGSTEIGQLLLADHALAVWS